MLMGSWTYVKSFFTTHSLNLPMQFGCMQRYRGPGRTSQCAESLFDAPVVDAGEVAGSIDGAVCMDIWKTIGCGGMSLISQLPVWSPSSMSVSICP